MVTATKINRKAASQRNREIVSGLGDKSIVLVGMMGCGKSAIGRIVASGLGVTFHDSDTEIETAADMSVAEIFERYGEPEFRRGEERVIARLLEEGPLVLALGGGAYLSEATREIIAERAISVWLQADLDLLLSRVMRRPGKRPLLQTGDPKQTLKDLLDQRSPIYAKTNLHVTSSRSSKAQTREAVLDAVHEYLTKN